MTTARLLFAAAFFGPLLAPAAAPAGWQGLDWGATPAEAEALSPASPADPGAFRGPMEGAGAVLTRPYAAAGAEFAAYLFFDLPGQLPGLGAVLLEAEAPACYEVEQQFTQTYAGQAVPMGSGDQFLDAANEAAVQFRDGGGGPCMILYQRVARPGAAGGL